MEVTILIWKLDERITSLKKINESTLFVNEFRENYHINYQAIDLIFILKNEILNVNLFQIMIKKYNFMLKKNLIHDLLIPFLTLIYIRNFECFPLI